jgi:hypothetical protein
MIVLYILLALVALFLLIGLVIPKELKSTRTIVINKPAHEIFDYIKFLKNQIEYSKWAKMDANAVYTYTGTDGQPGFISAWKGNKKVGEGEQEILKAENNRIDTELRFIKPFASKAKSFIEVRNTTSSTSEVSWGMVGNTPYPFNALKLFINFEKSIGNDFSEGLANLKQKMEG